MIGKIKAVQPSHAQTQNLTIASFSLHCTGQELFLRRLNLANFQQVRADASPLPFDALAPGTSLCSPRQSRWKTQP